MNFFIDTIENIYKNISIYFSIIIVNNKKDIKYISKKLKLCNHSTYSIYNNYTLNNFKMNDRIVIITYDLFYNFINIYNYNIFNFIAFYNIEYSIKHLLINYYYNISYNNNNNIIII